jgi:predicted NBD/HSP70 family sugar kinase
MTADGPVPVLEIGGTHVTAALADTSAGTVVPGTRHRQPLQADAGAAEILDAILACARRLNPPAHSPWGVAVPGPFDYAAGIALFEGVAKFESLYGLDMRKILMEALPAGPAHVHFLNDAYAFALGEWTAGAAQGHDRAVGITLGSGVGSAFLLHGCLIDDGPTVPPHGWVHLLTIAGQPLENTVSRRAIMARYADAAGAPAPGIDVRNIARRARDGDPAACRTFGRAFTALGRALGPWLAAFQATVLVVGGSISGSWDLIREPIRQGMDHTTPDALPRLHLSCAMHPADAPLLGAAWYAVHGHEKAR